MSKRNGIYWLLSMENLKRGSAWIALIVGGILYIFYFWIIPTFFEGTSDIVMNILETFAEVLVVGGVAGTLVNTAKDMGLFKHELEDLLYGKDFLKNRLDAPKIWRNFTETLYAAKFENIPPRLVETLQKLYLPDDPMYISTRSTSVSIKWGNEARTMIKVQVVDVFTLVTNTTEDVEYGSTTSINVEEKDNGIKTSVLEYRVGGIPVDVTSHNDTNGPFKYNDYSYKIKLSGRKQYDIVKKVIQEYSFLHDFTYAMNAKYPISDFTLDFSYPEDMRILFYDRGTLSGFETLTKEVGHLVVKSKGLILKRQGYLIAMREK